MTQRKRYADQRAPAWMRFFFVFFLFFFRLRQKQIDEIKKKQKSGSAGKRVGGALSALGRKFNKLTAQGDPELATEDHIEIEDDKEEEEEEEV